MLKVIWSKMCGIFYYDLPTHMTYLLMLLQIVSSVKAAATFLTLVCDGSM